MSTRVDNLIKDIQSATDPSIDDLEEIRIIIGNDDYPSSNIQNTVATGIFIYDNIQIHDVAFLCNTKNLNLVSIVALLLDSWDDAIELIDRIITKNQTTMYKFAIYLATKRLILVNQNGNEDELNNFFLRHNNHKVLYVGSKDREDYQGLVKNQIWIPHCSGQAYGPKPEECYAAYFDHSYSGNPQQTNNISIADFRL